MSVEVVETLLRLGTSLEVTRLAGGWWRIKVGDVRIADANGDGEALEDQIRWHIRCGGTGLARKWQSWPYKVGHVIGYLATREKQFSPLHRGYAERLARLRDGRRVP